MKTFIVIQIFLINIIFPQTKILKPMGQSGSVDEILKIRSMVNTNKSKKMEPYDNSVMGLASVIDTLKYAEYYNYNTNFGFFGQDVMVQWFEAPTDMIIKGVSFRSSDVTGPNVTAKLVKMNWSKEEVLTVGSVATHIGYYEAPGNGFNDIEPFIENDHEFEVGDWIPTGGDSLGSPFGLDLWSDRGFGNEVTVAEVGDRTWFDMNLLGEPEVLAGEMFGVAVKNSSNNFDADRHGVFANNGLGIPGFKFYNNGRFSSGGVADSASWGWWLRLYTWDMEVAVELTGDRAPIISDMTLLGTTLSNDPRPVSATIIDDNPSGGLSGVASAWLKYITNFSDEDSVVMSIKEGNVWEGILPGQGEGSWVEYYIEATDVEGNKAISKSSVYIIPPVHKTETLLVFNGLPATGFPSSYYFGIDDFVDSTTYFFDHDVWAYGPLSKDLVDPYRNIIEITSNGPLDINNQVIREWLEGDGSRNYMLAGDEWLGAQSGWGPQQYDGSFHKDILGITHEYNDIVSGSNSKSQVLTVPGSLLGNKLDSLSKSVKIDSITIGVDTLWYDPNYEINLPNWLDAVEATDDCDVFLKAIDPSNESIKNIGHSRVLPAGNKIAFLGYDPLSLYSAPYYWFGFSESAPQVQVLKWFGVTTDIEEKPEPIIQKFQLAQNYPNPFNPTTTINYELPITSDVKLIVYDVLGREVKVLVDKTQQTGQHHAIFDATGFASGIYYYRIKTSPSVSSGKAFEKTNKMLLLR